MSDPTPPVDPPADTPKPDPAKPDPKPEPDKDLGFPKDTPVAEMSYEQQAAYWKHHSRTHEGRNKGWRDVLGDKTPEDVKKELDALDELRRKGLSESEKAIEDARREERDKLSRDYGSRLVKSEFRAALAHLEGVDDRDGTDKRDRIISGLNLADYLTESGDVDTAKVKSYAADIAPADKGTGGKRVDFGAGKRTTTTASGVNAGADLFAEARGKKPAPTPST